MDTKTILKGIAGVGLSVADGLGFKVRDALKDAGVIANPEQETKTLDVMRQIELDFAQQETLRMSQVNETIRAEVSSPHWLVWAWRPTVGMTLALVVLNNYVLLPYLSGLGLKSVEIPDKTWEVMLAVVGVASLSRGVEKTVGVWRK